MVMINYKGGQLGNRMLSFAHFIANSLEYDYSLYNPEFNEYVPYFEGTSRNNFGTKQITVTRFGNRKIDKAFSLLIRAWTDMTCRLTRRNRLYSLYRIFKTHDRQELVFDLNDADFVRDARKKNTIVQGWLFRDFRHIEKYRSEICACFTPVFKFRSEVESVISSARAVGSLLIGVHIRRGDYARFANGQFFFTDEIYADKMTQLHNRYSTQGKQCVFILCSNDEVDLKKFPSHLTIIFEKRHYITDMYVLAACDAILGPPSTFSIWASYYGHIPLMQIETKDYQPEIGPYVSRC